MALLQLKDFACIRDDEPLFEPVNLSVKAGDIVQVAGPNGAGKTTLLRSLCGLFDSFTGDILWGDVAVRRQRYAFLSQLLYFGHHPGVKKSLTAGENLRWFAGINGQNQDAFLSPAQSADPGKSNPTGLDINSILSHVGLEGYADIPCQQMSAGQHRRVGLARLYFDQSPLWVLDEPFTAIDKQGVARLEQHIQQHAERGGMVILTTHQPLSISGFRGLELVRYEGDTL